MFAWKDIGMRPSDYVEEMCRALEDRLYISALNLTMIIPDVCATAMDPNDRTSKEKYKQWVDDYLEPVIAELSCISISSEDIYQLRNSILHNGSLASDTGKLTKYHNVRFYVLSDQRCLIISKGTTGMNNVSSEGGRELHLAVNLECYAQCVAEAVGRFLKEHPECDKECDKGRLVYGGLVDFTRTSTGESVV